MSASHRARSANVLGALYAAAAAGLPTLANGEYDGAGIGVHTPIKQPVGNQILSPDNRTYNQLLRGLRCLGERGFALLKGRRRHSANDGLPPITFERQMIEKRQASLALVRAAVA